MVLKNLCDYLDREQIRYTVISHSPAFTAQEIAAASPRLPSQRCSTVEDSRIAAVAAHASTSARVQCSMRPGS